jgi:hypothetical protein
MQNRLFYVSYSTRVVTRRHNLPEKGQYGYLEGRVTENFRKKINYKNQTFYVFYRIYIGKKRVFFPGLKTNFSKLTQMSKNRPGYNKKHKISSCGINGQLKSS